MSNPSSGGAVGRIHRVSARAMTITLGYDRIVYLGFACLMTLVIFFSIGFERGKHYARAESRPMPMDISPITSAPLDGTGAAPISPASAPSGGSPQRVIAVAMVTPAPQAASAARPSGLAPETQWSGPGYAIQVVTYAQKDKADREATRFQSSGFPSRVVPKGRFYEIHLGPFADKIQANTKLSELRRRGGYADAFLRKLKDEAPRKG